MTKPLNKFIRENYGSQKQLATLLGVGEHTVMRWLKHEPEYFMKHAFEMSASKSKEKRKKFIMELMAAVDEQIEIIRQN